MIKINLCIDEQVLETMKSLSGKQGRKYSDFIREAINKLIKEYENLDKK